MVKNKPHGYEDLSEPDMGPRDSEVNLTCSAQPTAGVYSSQLCSEFHTAGDHFPTTASAVTLTRQSTF